MKDATLSILREGGVVLWALLALAVGIYSLATAVWWHCRKTRRKVVAGEWSRDTGIGAALPWDRATKDRRQVGRDFATFELDEIAWVERRLPFLGVLIGSAPLLGLLGTVAGMLVTFGGMASSTAGEPIDKVSAGISKAMVTTQAGLVVAVPAAFLLALLKRQANLTRTELQRQLHEKLAGSEPPAIP